MVKTIIKKPTTSTKTAKKAPEAAPSKASTNGVKKVVKTRTPKATKPEPETTTSADTTKGRRGVRGVVPENMGAKEKAEYDAIVRRARSNGLLNSTEAALVCNWARNTWYIYMGREGAPTVSKVEGVTRYFKGRDVLRWKKEAMDAPKPVRGAGTKKPAPAPTSKKVVKKVPMKAVKEPVKKAAPAKAEAKSAVKKAPVKKARVAKK